MSSDKQENIDTLNVEYYKAKIEVLERENERLRDIISGINTIAKDPNFDKRISELNKDYK